MGIKNPEMVAPRGLRGGSDIWDTPSGAILSDEFFSTPVGGPVLFSIGVKALSITRLGTGTTLGLSIGTRVTQYSTLGIRYVLSLKSATKSVAVAGLGAGTRLSAAVLNKALSWTAQSIGMVMLPPPVVFAIQRYVLGVQGAPVQIGSVQATSGLVVPRATLPMWLLQHNEEVLMQRGCVCILRSGTVVFVVG